MKLKDNEIGIKAVKLPPHSIEVEAIVLGTLLHYPEQVTADAVRFGINRNSFYDLRHIEIFEAAQSVMALGQLPHNVIVAQRLTAENRLEGVGGLSYIAGLPDIAATLFGVYVEQLHDFRARRDVLKQLTTIEDRAHDLLEPLDTLKGDLDAAVALSNRGRTSLPEIQPITTFVERDIEAPRELVYGLLHQGTKLVLGGGSKTFKTWTLMDLALSIAYGEPWLSFKTTRGKVLYLNFELAEFAFQKRLRSIAQSKGIKLSTSEVDFWHLRGQAASYDILFPKIIERIKTCGYSLIILDPIYKCYGGTDENSAGQVAMLLNAIEKLTVETGAAVAFGAHYAKGNAASKEAIDRISGSGVFARDPDTILSFTRHETADAFTVDATLRNFKPIEPFVVRWIYPLMRMDETLDPAKLKIAGRRAPQFTVEKLMACLKGKTLTSRKWCEAAIDELGLSRARFYKLFEQAREHPYLKQTTDGEWFYEAPAGSPASLVSPLD